MEPVAPVIFSSNQLRSHFLSSGHATIWNLVQLVDALDKTGGGDLYLEVFPRAEKRHRIWPEVPRDHKFPALAAGGGDGTSQTAHRRGEKRG
jgi:hypothetical protein